MVLTAGAAALLFGILVSAGVTGIGLNAGIKNDRNKRVDSIKSQLIGRSQDPSDPLYGLTSADIDRLVSEYRNEDFDLMDVGTWGGGAFNWDDFNADLQDYNSWKNIVGEMPQDIDYDAIKELANKTIDDENAQLMALYDEMLGRNTSLFEDSLKDSNQMYNDYASQILSNQAQSQNMLQGSVRSELDRSQRNAITRGANAAMKLVSNINAQLGLQNQAAQQSLATSNNLAQALINQRQAAMQLRQQYTGSLNDYTQQKAGLISGSAERKSNYRGALTNEAEDTYNKKMTQWEDNLSGYSDSSVWGDLHRNSNLRNRSGL